VVNLFTGQESTELFGGEVSPAVQRLIDQARSATADEAQAALWTAVGCAPEQLPVYYLLYKLHASQGQLDLALQAAQKGLAAAAQAAGLALDWAEVRPGDADFSANGPARFWLFTLKALAFIHVRRGEREPAARALAHLRQLDPQDLLGAGTIERMLQASVAD